ncbi:MAG: sterol-binding protein [Gammaproteobacteria bacterium]|nr:MAG: sterol-binding protein [Gammaproteobacteria bacterium]
MSIVTRLMLAPWEFAFNRALDLDPDTRRALGKLAGKVIALELRGLGLTLYIVPGLDGVTLTDTPPKEPDAWLSGTPFALLRLRMGSEKPLFEGEVEIRGDVELGQRFKAILDAMTFDWEEALSRVTGDVVAHQVGNAFRGLAGWGQQTADALARNVADYLKGELGLLPQREEVEIFIQAVDELRMDADRLEQRILRLEAALDIPAGEGGADR